MCTMKTQIIPVYAANLKTRIDRKENIILQFENKKEFCLNVIPAIDKYKTGAFGLWKTIQHIIKYEINKKEDYFVFCEDDHDFTEHYSPDLLLNCIEKAKLLDADILSGGVSWFQTGIQITENLFWIEKFSGLQFVIIFKKIYKKILNAHFSYNDVADYKISSLTDNKFVIYPYISTQKEFGYSDITMNNNEKGHVSQLFRNASNNFSLLRKIRNYYCFNSQKENSEGNSDFIIPTYIINTNARKGSVMKIYKEFANKSEFEIHVVEASKNNLNEVNLWSSIVEIIEMAIKNDDEVIIICKNNHTFTKYYERDVLIRNILDAYEIGADILSGNIGDFHNAVSITPNIYWVDRIGCSSFFVIYSKFFKKISNTHFSVNNTVDEIISTMTINKMVLYPFISDQKNPRISRALTTDNEFNCILLQSNKCTSERLRMHQKIYEKYLPHLFRGKLGTTI